MRITALIVLVLVLLAGCRARGGTSVPLPSEPLLSGGMGWALVVSAYAPLRAAPDKEAAQSGTMRRGEIREIAESRFDRQGPDSGGIWYLTKPAANAADPATSTSGWLHSSDISLYPNEARAANAAEAM